MISGIRFRDEPNGSDVIPVICDSGRHANDRLEIAFDRALHANVVAGRLVHENARRATDHYRVIHDHAAVVHHDDPVRRALDAVGRRHHTRCPSTAAVSRLLRDHSECPIGPFATLRVLQ